jgi:hypothetical protein
MDAAPLVFGSSKMPVIRGCRGIIDAAGRLVASARE